MSPICSLSRASALVLVVAFASACGGSQSGPAPAPPPAAPAEDAGASLTAAQCKQAGGEVVGDIGDGAIHRPDYRCPRSGEPPLGAIAPEPGQPMPVEGAVCCR